mmetsp:Transcript_22022/g.25461  ORF Transcript_22022/g.25461 Transcript_22022/m.25461 type:complete len:350 (+) Transcript_22022:260-1309(+)
MTSIQPSSLHFLLEGKKWKDAEELLHSNPSSAFEIGSSFKALPLHFALMNQPPLWIVDSLIEANPVAVTSKNEFGLLPIRLAIRSKCSTEIIKTLIREGGPESVKCFGVSGKTCLHLACLYGCSIEVIDELLLQWLEAAQWRDRDGWHPLHLACLVERDPQIIARLLEAYPNAAAMPDTPEHHLPMHLAVLHNASINTLKKIYEAYPDAIKCPTQKGWLPLHLACRKSTSSETMGFLLDCYADGAKIHGKCLSLPLHLASRYGSSMECLKMLVDAYPAALGERNSFGETPFTGTYHEEDLRYNQRTTSYSASKSACEVPITTTVSHEGNSPSDCAMHHRSSVPSFKSLY